jgi:hypothetical protein
MRWDEKGCFICRRQWETGIQPRRLGINLARQTYLHQCNECRSFWEQYERYADVISSEEAQRFYPDLIEKMIL